MCVAAGQIRHSAGGHDAIVVYEKNRIVVNGDLWFGVCAKSANAGATEAGIIKVGTQA